MSYQLIGAAMGWGAQIVNTEKGPDVLKAAFIEKDLENTSWQTIVKPSISALEQSLPQNESRLPIIKDHLERLSHECVKAIDEKNVPVVLGGDHVVAVGTWSGVVSALKAYGSFGLIWIDAHMDANTPETSPSQAYHGMPAAALLGYGANELCFIGGEQAKIDPKHLVYIGIRSFEEGEAELLERLGVKVFFMDEVKERGFKTVFREALAIVGQAQGGFGVTLDLDAFDPKDVPAVGSPEKDGINVDDACQEFENLHKNKSFKAFEITEFNPDRDVSNQTLEVIRKILQATLR